MLVESLVCKNCGSRTMSYFLNTDGSGFSLVCDGCGMVQDPMDLTFSSMHSHSFGRRKKGVFRAIRRRNLEKAIYGRPTSKDLYRYYKSSMKAQDRKVPNEKRKKMQRFSLREMARGDLFDNVEDAAVV